MGKFHWKVSLPSPLRFLTIQFPSSRISPLMEQTKQRFNSSIITQAVKEIRIPTRSSDSNILTLEFYKWFKLIWGYSVNINCTRVAISSTKPTSGPLRKTLSLDFNLWLIIYWLCSGLQLNPPWDYQLPDKNLSSIQL